MMSVSGYRSAIRPSVLRACSGNPAASSVSDAQEVFTYSSMKPLYYAVSGRYDTVGADIAVVSLVDGNRFTNGVSTSPNRNAGFMYTFAAAENSSTTIISARGAVTTRGVGDGFDTLVPISFAGTSFVLPTERGTQEVSIYAPFVDATVNLYDGTSLIGGSPITVSFASGGSAPSTNLRNLLPLRDMHRTLPEFLGSTRQRKTSGVPYGT